jgi:hypothetical protein
VVRPRRDGFPFRELDFDPSLAVFSGALAQERHRRRVIDLVLYEVVQALVPFTEELLVLLTASVSGVMSCQPAPAARRENAQESLNPSLAEVVG